METRRWQPSNAVAALNGVLLQMFNHGLTAATLFWFFCISRTTKRRIARLGAISADCGGWRRSSRVDGGGVVFVAGLPGLNGFVGEFLIFKGTFGLAPWAAVLSLPGLLITAVFLGRDSSGVSWAVEPGMVGFGDLTWLRTGGGGSGDWADAGAGVFPAGCHRVVQQTVVEMVGGRCLWLKTDDVTLDHLCFVPGRGSAAVDCRGRMRAPARLVALGRRFWGWWRRSEARLQTGPELRTLVRIEWIPWLGIEYHLGRTGSA
jgi:hypothetical protein